MISNPMFCSDIRLEVFLRKIGQKTIARYNTQVAFPNHQDNLYNGKWSKSMDEFSSEIQAELKNLGSITQFINPEPYKWYTILMGISKED